MFDHSIESWDQTSYLNTFLLLQQKWNCFWASQISERDCSTQKGCVHSQRVVTLAVVLMSSCDRETYEFTTLTVYLWEWKFSIEFKCVRLFRIILVEGLLTHYSVSEDLRRVLLHLLMCRRRARLEVVEAKSWRLKIERWHLRRRRKCVGHDWRQSGVLEHLLQHAIHLWLLSGIQLCILHCLLNIGDGQEVSGPIERCIGGRLSHVHLIQAIHHVDVAALTSPHVKQWICRVRIGLSAAHVDRVQLARWVKWRVWSCGGDEIRRKISKIQYEITNSLDWCTGCWNCCCWRCWKWPWSRCCLWLKFWWRPTETPELDELSFLPYCCCCLSAVEFSLKSWWSSSKPRKSMTSLIDAGVWNHSGTGSSSVVLCCDDRLCPRFEFDSEPMDEAVRSIDSSHDDVLSLIVQLWSVDVLIGYWPRRSPAQLPFDWRWNCGRWGLGGGGGRIVVAVVMLSKKFLLGVEMRNVMQCCWNNSVANSLLIVRQQVLIALTIGLLLIAPRHSSSFLVRWIVVVLIHRIHVITLKVNY